MSGKSDARAMKSFLTGFIWLFLGGFVTAVQATVISEVVVDPAVVTLGQGAKAEVYIQSTADEVSDAVFDLELYRGTVRLATWHRTDLTIAGGNANDPGITRVAVSLTPAQLTEPGSYHLVARLTGIDIYQNTDSGQGGGSPPPQPGPVPQEGQSTGGGSSATSNSSVPFDSSRTTYFTVKGQAIALSVSRLGLEGGAGDVAQGEFQVVAGEAPFHLTSQQGATFSNADPGLNESVVYRFQIPVEAQPGDTYQDQVIVRGADGVEASLPVEISVKGGDAENPGDEGVVEDVALTPPQKSVGGAIDTLCASGSAQPRLQQDCTRLTRAASNPDTAGEAALALAAITADQARVPVTMAHNVLTDQSRNLGIRLAALRGGAIGVSVRGLALSIDGKTLPVGVLAQALSEQLSQDVGGSAGSDDLFESERWGFFVNGSISGGDKSRTENEAGFDFDVVSLTLGMDYRFSPRLVAGAALGYSRNDTDLDDNGGYLDTTGYNLSLYGSWFDESGLYLEGILTKGWSDYDQMRVIQYRLEGVSVDQQAKAGYDGDQWSAALGGGRVWSLEAWSLTASARVEYIHARVDAFDERMSRPDAEGGGWAVHVAKQKADSLTSQLGLELSRALSVSWGVVMPTLSLEWLHEFKDNPGGVSGHFLQDNSRTLFFLPTDDYDSDYFSLGLGASVQLAGGLSGFVHYRQLLGYQDLDAWSLQAGLRVAF